VRRFEQLKTWRRPSRRLGDETKAEAKRTYARARGNVEGPLADHGEMGPVMAADGGDCEKGLDRFAQAGVNVDTVAARLQDESVKSFLKSWNELIAVIASKIDALGQAV